jgi:DNA-binding NarL/FixJ family response regulator
MATLRIVLADDHLIVRAGIRALIDQQPDMRVVGEASDGVEALALAQHFQPDVVVMDLSMPRLNGADATQELRKLCPQANVLVLTVHEDTTYLRRVLEAGATGYVLKYAAPESLIAAIRQVAGGTVYLDPALSDTLVNVVIGAKERAGGEQSALSEREAMVLRLIAQGYSNKEIAGQLDLSVKTVETYKARGMEKLGISSRVDLVRYATTRGWLTALDGSAERR